MSFNLPCHLQKSDLRNINRMYKLIKDTAGRINISIYMIYKKHVLWYLCYCFNWIYFILLMPTYTTLFPCHFNIMTERYLSFQIFVHRLSLSIHVLILWSLTKTAPFKSKLSGNTIVPIYGSQAATLLYLYMAVKPEVTVTHVCLSLEIVRYTYEVMQLIIHNWYN